VIRRDFESSRVCPLCGRLGAFGMAKLVALSLEAAHRFLRQAANREEFLPFGGLRDADR
jgi:hypothetical protein